MCVSQRATEKEVLQSADVVCTTCVGAGDPRLTNFRFRKVRAQWAAGVVAMLQLESGSLLRMKFGSTQCEVCATLPMWVLMTGG